MKGIKALPEIFEIADLLGEKGRYPYSGVMAAAIASKDESAIDHAARKLLVRFQQRLDPSTAGFDFAEMLNSSESRWPKDILLPAIETAVEGVEQYPENDTNREFETKYSIADASVTAHGPVQMGLLRIAWLVKRYEPELWVKMVREHPNLATVPADGFGRPGGMMMLSFGRASSQDTPPEERTHDRVLSEIDILVATHPDKASAAISTIMDPDLRAEALSFAAQQLASVNPQKSAQFAAQAEQVAASVKNPERQFQAACARLRSDATNKNLAVIPGDLDTAFQLADKVMRKTQDEGEDTGYVITPLVVAVGDAAKVEPELTVAHIEMVYLPFEKAQMLMVAATALAGPDQSTKAPPKSAE
jgi:hypothetical protein